MMDATAIAFCRDNKLPIVVFDMSARRAARDPRGRARRHDHHDDPAGRPQPERGRPHACARRAPAARYAGRRDRRDPSRSHRKDGQSRRARAVAVHDRAHGSGHAGPRRKLKVDYYGIPVPLQQLAGVPGARGPPADRQAPRPGLARADREGDPRQRPRRLAVQRRCRHPSELPGAHRRAPQGVREDRQAPRRGRPHRRPQPPPRRPQAPRGSREGQRDLRRRARTSREGDGEDHPRPRGADRHGVRAARSRNCSRSEPRPVRSSCT